MFNSLWSKCLGFLIFMFVVGCLTISPVFSATYYVSSSAGNDAQNGTSQSSAWKTLSKVNSIAFQAGDTVLFKRGDVWIKQQLLIRRDGTDGRPITFSSYGTGELPKFDAAYDSSVFYGVYLVGRSWIVLDGLDIYRFGKGVGMENGANNITLKNSRISHMDGECVRVRGNSRNVTIDNNEIHDCGQKSNGEGIYVGTDPVQTGGVPDSTKSVTIKNNEIYNTSNEAIELKAGTSACIVQSNLIHHVHDSSRGAIHTGLWTKPLITPNHVIDSNTIFNVGGIGIELRAANLQVTRNTIYNARLDAINIQDAERTGQVPKVYNNTLYKNGGSGLKLEYRALAEDKNNLAWGNSSGNFGSDPLFANPSGADFRLCQGVGFPASRCPGRSTAIDAGVKVGLPFIGIAPDLGAEESTYAGGPAPSSPPLAPSNPTLVLQ